MIVKDIEIPHALEGCRNVWLYFENGEWVLSARSQVIAKFTCEADAAEWWHEFETTRGFNAKSPKRSKPVKRKVKIQQTNFNPENFQEHRMVRPTTPERRQALLAKINQGRYDNERELLNLLKNATDRGEDKILKAVHQRLKIVVPETYRKLIGPLNIRDPLGIKKCYCAHPASLRQIADEIITDSIAEECLLCDACWEEDICSAWGHYGAWGAKIIDSETWRTICARRGDTKYATY